MPARPCARLAHRKRLTQGGPAGGGRMLGQRGGHRACVAPRPSKFEFQVRLPSRGWVGPPARVVVLSNCHPRCYLPKSGTCGGIAICRLAWPFSAAFWWSGEAIFSPPFLVPALQPCHGASDGCQYSNRPGPRSIYPELSLGPWAFMCIREETTMSMGLCVRLDINGALSSQ